MIHILCIAVQNAAWRTNLVQMYVTFRVLCSFATVTQCYQHWVTIPETSPSFHKANHEDVESIRCEVKMVKYTVTLHDAMTHWTRGNRLCSSQSLLPLAQRGDSVPAMIGVWSRAGAFSSRKHERSLRFFVGPLRNLREETRPQFSPCTKCNNNFRSLYAVNSRWHRWEHG